VFLLHIQCYILDFLSIIFALYTYIMKIAIAQLNYHIGNFTGNLEKILASIDRAKEDAVDIICFGELAITGYPPRDFLEFKDFITKSEAAIEEINSAYFIADGEILHVQHKALLPTYDIFDEYRYFEPATTFDIVEYKGQRIALTVCEDIWNIANENPLYVTCPLDHMIKQSPDFVINLSASPFDYDHAHERVEIVRQNALRYKLPLFYVNHVGAQTEVIFDGGSVVMSGDGKIYDEMSYFIEDYKVYDLEQVKRGAQSFEQPRKRKSVTYAF